MLKLNKNNIAVVPVQDPDQTEGGIWIPDIAKKRANQGVVKYIGAEVKDIKVGDYVLFSGYTGTTIEITDEGKLIILHQDFVNAIIGIGEKILVPGLFVYDKKSDIFYEAPYETVVQLAAWAMEDFGRELNVVTDKPKVEDYNKK